MNDEERMELYDAIQGFFDNFDKDARLTIATKKNRYNIMRLSHDTGRIRTDADSRSPFSALFDSTTVKDRTLMFSKSSESVLTIPFDDIIEYDYKPPEESDVAGVVYRYEKDRKAIYLKKGKYHRIELTYEELCKVYFQAQEDYCKQLESKE